MADGDIIHPNLNRRFQNVYGQICEGHWDAPTLGYKMLHPLKEQLKEYGNAPVLMGQKIIPLLKSPSFPNNDGRSQSFFDVSNEIAEICIDPNLNCSPRGRDLMVEAAKKTLVEIQHGQTLEDVEFALFKNYTDTIYVRDFEDRIQETPTHFKGASHNDVCNLIEDIRPYVERGQNEFAKQLMKNGDVQRLRRPNKLKESPLTIEDPAW